MVYRPDKEFALQLDAQDDLASLREKFIISDPDLVYVDGNSLGRLPAATLGRLQEAVAEQWGSGLIGGWGANWYEAPSRIGEQVARLIGAGPDQVLVSDSTSVNLFKLSLASLSMRPERTKIVSDVLNFPTDLYILQSGIRLLGDRHALHLVSSQDGNEIEMDTQSILDAIDGNTCLVTFSHPTFKSAYLYEVEKITRRAHQAGALVLWDFSHGVGSIPLEVDQWEVDFAVGCTYKYLNGGPGAPAFLYVRRDLQEQALSPIMGWWGHKTPFSFDLGYTPAEGIRRFLAGSPPVLSLLSIEPSLEIFSRVGIAALRQKSIQLTSYLVYLYDLTLAPLGFSLGSPREPDRRGSHVSIRHPDGYRIYRAMVEEMKVIPDFREPDNIRLGLVPSYTTFLEVWEAVNRIRMVIEEKRHLKYSTTRSKIT
jgi:kynureninase